jgi:hypothetical protein
MGFYPTPHIHFCPYTKKDAKKVKADAVFPKNYGSIQQIARLVVDNNHVFLATFSFQFTQTVLLA